MDPESTTLPVDPFPTRYSLLSRLRNWEDEESWRLFFDTYWRLVYSFALKAGLTRVEAEEVVQETIICVAKNIQTFKRDRQLGSFKGWLHNLTRWRIADQFKKRTQVVPQDQSGAKGESQSPECAVDPADEAAVLDWDHEWRSHLLQTAKQRVKSQVKEEQYQLFDLYVVKEWPVKRIRQTLEVSATQVYLAKHRVTRLLEKEVRRLEKEWDPQ